MNIFFRPTFTLFALAFAVSTSSLHAQAPAPRAAASKPTAKPAAKAPAAPQVRRATFEPSIQATKPASTEKLLSREELKACFARQMKNEADATGIKGDQEAYKKDYEQVKADQVALAASLEANRNTQGTLTQERRAISSASDGLQAKASANAKPTEADKVAWDAERAALVTRAKALDDGIAAYNIAVQATRDRSQAIDARVPGINERQKAINMRVEALQEALKQWRTDCADKAYDEADEAVVKKELGMK